MPSRIHRGFEMLLQPERQPTSVGNLPPAAEAPVVGGGFTGLMRRPRPQKVGMMVQIFGENGPDADIISLFHQTRYVDHPARVLIYRIKDASGRILRHPDAARPDVQFEGRIQRPSASLSGQTAQFMAPNGPHADAVLPLGATAWLDSTVHVVVDPILAEGASILLADADELERAARVLTPSERNRHRQSQRLAREGDRILHAANFYRNERLWRFLDPVLSFRDWLLQQSCAWPAGQEACPLAATVLVPLSHLAGDRTMAHAPMCHAHAEAWNRGDLPTGWSLQAAQSSLNARQVALAQRWAETALRLAVNCPQGHLPLPPAIRHWAVGAGCLDALPPQFLRLVDESSQG